jgi:hypothetical protein
VSTPFPKARRKSLPDLVGDLRQLACVRQVTLQDGAEANQRALIFSTGGGLDFWVMQDRSMDIGILHWQGMPVAWQHPAGFMHPALQSPYDAQATGVETSLGGFLVTCGLDNVRQPQNGLPLHGTLPYTPARLLTSGADWNASTPYLFAEAEMVSAHLGRHAFRLTRRIEAPIAQGIVSVVDRIENIGPDAAEMRILYHVNFGFPAVGDGTQVRLNGQTVTGPETAAAESDQTPLQVECQRSGKPGSRFKAELVRPSAGSWPGFAASISGPSDALPFFQIWRDRRARRNVLALEPVNCARNEDGTSAEGKVLAPGEIWEAKVVFEFSKTSDTTTSVN